MRRGFGMRMRPKRRAASSAVVSNQTAVFGAQTVAGGGGFRPVDANDNTVALTSYNSLVSGSLGVYTPSISAGALVFSGAAGCPNAAVLRCGHAGGTVDITISSRANCYSVLPTTAAIDAALTAITVTGGKDVLVRRGVADNTSGWRPAQFTAFVAMVYIEGEGVAASGKGTRFTSIYAPSVNNIGFRNIEIDGSASTAECIAGGTDSAGYCGRYDVVDCWVHGIYHDPSVTYTTGGAFQRTNAGIGITPAGPGSTFARNLIEHVAYGIQTQIIAAITIQDNEIRYYFDDAIQASFYSGVFATFDGTAVMAFDRNVAYSPIELDGAHADGTQVYSANVVTLTNFKYRQNVLFNTPGLASGSTQGMFLTGAYTLSGAVICGNIIAGVHLNAFVAERIVGGAFNNNTLVRVDTTGAGADTPNFLLGAAASSGAVSAKRNICDIYGLAGGATYTTTNNLTLGNRGATNSYTSVFEWVTPSTPATTLAQIKANLVRDAAGPASADAGALYPTWFTIGQPRTPAGWSYNAACEA